MSAPRISSPAVWVVTAILLVSAASLQAAIRYGGLYLRKLPINVELKLSSIPSQTPHWRQVSVDQALDEAVQEKMGTTNHITRRYVRIDTENTKHPQFIELHLAYYTGMIDTVPHVPDRCLVGAGLSIAHGPWTIPVPLDRGSWMIDDAATAEARAAGESDATIYTVRLGPTSRAPGNRVRLPRGIENVGLRVSEFSMPGSDRKLFAGYFFAANGGLTSTAEGVRLLAFDLRSDYAYYLKVQVSCDTCGSAEELATLGADLLSEVLPDIMLCVPDWTDVQRGDFPTDNPRRKTAAAAK